MARRGSTAGNGLGRALRLATVVALMAVMVPLGAPAASAGPGEADIYWVDVTNGDNADPGTEAEPFQTITYAASQADALDTIMVQPGTYGGASGETWPIVFNGASLVSVDGADTTIIWGDGSHQALAFTGWADGDRLQGFTIRNGGVMSASSAVQTTLVTATSPATAPRIENCIFYNNAGGSTGGGLYAYCQPGTNLVISNNEFTNNAAVYGGGMTAVAYGNLTITENEFTSNAATYGAAAYLYSSMDGAVLVDGNTFIGNTATNSGGAIQWAAGSLTQMHSVQGNTFMSNSALHGGVFYLTAVNLAITGNEAGSNSGGVGTAGFAYLENADVLAESNYLVQNTAVNNGSVWTVDPNSTLTEINDTLTGNYGSSYVTYADVAATLHVLNCIYWNETTPVEMSHADSVAYSCSSDDAATLISGGSTIGAGMVYADPQFDVGNLPALLDGSPCIDAGGPWDAPGYDFFGTAIPQDGNGDRVKWADIGCYEAPGVPLPTVYPVYRFYNFTNNTHFFTNSAEEADHVIATWPNVYRYEGIAYYTNPLNNTQPLYRFYNRRSASHFYTASAEEAAHIMATWPDIFSYDGQTYSVSPVPVLYSYAVFRFYNKTNGSHFYTASAEEAYIVNTNWPHIYTDEGPAFWIGQ